MELFPVDEASLTWLDERTTELLDVVPDYARFGAHRKHGTHCGVDLHCPVGTEVYACGPGILQDICIFTGPEVDLPWYETTYAAVVKHRDMYCVYGEIDPNLELNIGDQVHAHTLLGTVLRVLKKDRGLPMSMLHFEMYGPKWTPGMFGEAPPGADLKTPNDAWANLLDPTPYLSRLFLLDHRLIISN